MKSIKEVLNTTHQSQAINKETLVIQSQTSETSNGVQSIFYIQYWKQWIRNKWVHNLTTKG